MKSSTIWIIITLFMALSGVYFIAQIEVRGVHEVLSYLNACLLGTVLSMIVYVSRKLREHRDLYHKTGSHIVRS